MSIPLPLSQQRGDILIVAFFLLNLCYINLCYITYMVDLEQLVIPVILTGASQGIGAEVAYRLAAHGAPDPGRAQRRLAGGGRGSLSRFHGRWILSYWS